MMPVWVWGELIHTSALGEVKKEDMKVKRNIFSPRKPIASAGTGKTRRIPSVKKPPEKKKAEETEKDRVIATVFYEGFLLKGEKRFALLKVNGRYYIPGEGDLIDGKIRLKTILEKKVLLEIESSEITIVKKGERDVN